MVDHLLDSPHYCAFDMSKNEDPPHKKQKIESSEKNYRDSYADAFYLVVWICLLDGAVDVQNKYIDCRDELKSTLSSPTPWLDVEKPRSRSIIWPSIPECESIQNMLLHFSSLHQSESIDEKEDETRDWLDWRYIFLPSPKPLAFALLLK